MKRAWAWLGVSAVVGCSPANAGVDASTAVFVDRGMVDATPDFGPAPAHDAAVGDLAGDHWDGTIDGDPFPSGSHRVQLIFDHATGDLGPRTGVVVLGMAALPPPPRDPGVGYPLGFGFDDLGSVDVTEGFVYPMLDAAATDGHLHVRINAYGLWERWCELQTPMRIDDVEADGFGCLPEGGGQQTGDECLYGPANGPSFPIDCGRMLLCMPPGFCDCAADGCSARVQRDVVFELDVTGDGASGTVSLRGGHVTMTRM